MSNLTQRLLLTAVALPALVGVVFLLPYANYLAVALVASGFSGLGALEISRMLARRGTVIHPAQAFLSGILLPLAGWFDTTAFMTAELFIPLLILSVGLIVARQAFIFRNGRLAGVLEKTAASVLLIIYPGLFMSYIPRISSLPWPGLSILLFLSLVFANDSCAYIFGMLLGRGNRNLFAASPNKSAAGLAGGFAGAVGAAYLFFALQPALFAGKAGLAIPLAFLCSLAANIGDLAESAMKRSADVKDSGHILKGRGGVMDSIDSILFAAPVFFYTLPLIIHGVPLP